MLGHMWANVRVLHTIYVLREVLVGTYILWKIHHKSTFGLENFVKFIMPFSIKQYLAEVLPHNLWSYNKFNNFYRVFFHIRS